MRDSLLTEARRGWLAVFFRNAGLILLAGVLSDAFVKLPVAGRVALVAGFVLVFVLGFLSATKAAAGDRDNGA